MNPLSQRPVCCFCDQFRSASFLSEANSASFTMSIWLQEISRRAPLEQGTTQQMSGRSCLPYDSAIVVENHYILPGGEDNLQANTTLYYENTWPSSALPIPRPAAFSCDVKMTKARAVTRKVPRISPNQEKRRTPPNSCLLSKDFPFSFIASSKSSYVINRKAGNPSHEESQGETSLAVTA